jgi:prepilin-type N-terminal cleavage/methylation domain-containing protein
MRPRGFTLVELLAVVGCLAVLSAIISAVYLQGIPAAKKTSCVARLRQVAAAIQMYMPSNDGLPPPSLRVLPDADTIRFCPAKDREGQQVAYVYTCAYLPSLRGGNWWAFWRVHFREQEDPIVKCTYHVLGEQGVEIVGGSAIAQTGHPIRCLGVTLDGRVTNFLLVDDWERQKAPLLRDFLPRSANSGENK